MASSVDPAVELFRNQERCLNRQLSLPISDGAGVVVKRVERVRDARPVRLRLLSANPDYAPYTCLAEEARISFGSGCVLLS